MVHSHHCSFRISRVQEKIATQGDCTFPVSRAQAKKTRQGLNSPSNFRAHEKMVHWTITRFLIFMLVKKQSIQGQCH